MSHGRWPGTNRVICDICGFEYASDEVKKRWDGFITCHADWEPKHPQLSIRAGRESQAPAIVRTESPPVFVPMCTLITKQAIPGIGTPGCAIPSHITNLPS